MTTTANETKHTPEPWANLIDALDKAAARFRGIVYWLDDSSKCATSTDRMAYAQGYVAQCAREAQEAIDSNPFPAQFIERAKRIEAAAKNAHEYLGKLTFIDGDGAGANVAVRKELRTALEAQ